MAWVIGLDIGTSSTKGLLVDEAGQVVASASHPYELIQPAPGWAEQNPEDWWEATCTVVRKLIQKAGIQPSEVKALGLSGQMHGMVLIDQAGQVVRPPILWCDVRTTAECRAIEEAVGLEDLLQFTGNPALEGFTAPKLVWMQRHEPDALARAETLLLPKDYIRFRLTGERRMEISDAAGSLLFDVRAGTWSEPVLERLGLPPSLLPPVVGSWEVAGQITAEAAEATGLPVGTPVVGGGADNACGALGAGVIDPGQALVSIGTSGVVLSPLSRPPATSDGKLHLFNHALPERWYLMGVMLSVGLSYRWFRDELAPLEKAAGQVTGIDAFELLNREAASAPPGAGGVLFLPYLNGERTPHADPHARGTFFGISSAHRRAHLVRAVMEGITFGLRDSLELMRATGQPVSRLRAIGGGAKSDLWLQIQADILDAVVERPVVDEGPAYGAALLAGVGAGWYRTPHEAAQHVAVQATYEPNPETREVYDETYQLYRDLYPALQPLFPRVAALGG